MDDFTAATPFAEMPPIDDQAGLHRTWTTLMGVPGFSRRQLWVLLVGPDGRPLMSTKVDELPPRPDAPTLRSLVGALCSLGEGITFAFLYARPGRARRTADDLAWAEGLVTACRDAGVKVWPVHLGTDDSITVVAPDDLADAG